MEMPQDYIKYKIKTTLKETFRRKEKQKFSRPDDVAELRKLIESQTPRPPCNCDICDAARYARFANYLFHLHEHPKLKSSSSRNESGNGCYKPPTEASLLRSEAMEATRTAIQYFDRPADLLNSTQLASLRSLQE